MILRDLKLFRSLFSAAVLAFGILGLSGCNSPTIQAALRQSTEGNVAPPEMAEVQPVAEVDAGLRLRDASPGAETRASQITVVPEPQIQVSLASYTPPAWRAISNSELFQWQSQQASVFADQNPAVRPRRMPKPFSQVDWNNYLPFFPDVTKATLTSDYGWRRVNGRLDFHPAIDIAAPANTLVFSPLNGRVLHVSHGNAQQAGVVLTSGERQYTFWHVTPRPNLRPGQVVRAGEPVGSLTPWGSRTHLHFAVHLTGSPKPISARNDKNAVDPISTTWRAMHSGVDLFAPSQTTGRSILGVNGVVASRLGF